MSKRVIKNSKKIEMITNDDELFQERISSKKVFIIVTLFIASIIFFLSTTLELKEDKADTLWNSITIVILVLILLFYFNMI
jgi:hypothetical protein